MLLNLILPAITGKPAHINVCVCVCACVTHLGVNPYSTDGADLKIVSCRDRETLSVMSHVISVYFNMHQHINLLIASM